MTPQELLDRFRASEEPKGYYLHADKNQCLEIAQSLLDNREKYGYLNCPCRLAQNSAKLDKDIICPCDYRGEDIQLQGACFCLLFVDEAHKDDIDFCPEVDDRRIIG